MAHVLHETQKVLIKPKDTLKAFVDFKHKQKSVRNNVFWYVNIYVYSESLFSTLYTEIKHKY